MSLLRVIITLCLEIFFIFLFSFPVFAAALSISNVPSTIDQSQEFEVDVSLSCSGCDDSYLRGVFYPSGTSYFGYTQDNSGSWSNASGSNCTTFLKVAQSDLQAGTWNGKVRVKLDTNNAYYKGPGGYFFKVGRYTSSCGSPVWSSETTISVTGPTPTPLPTATLIPTSIPANTPTPTKTPTPTPTQKPTATTKPNPTATSIPATPVPTKVSTGIVSPTQSFVADSAGEKTNPTSKLEEQGVLAASDEASVASLSASETNKNSSNVTPWIVMVFIGVVFIAASGILAFRSYKQTKEEI